MTSGISEANRDCPETSGCFCGPCCTDTIDALRARVQQAEAALTRIRQDSIGQPESTFVTRCRMHVNSVLGGVL